MLDWKVVWFTVEGIFSVVLGMLIAGVIICFILALGACLIEIFKEVIKKYIKNIHKE